MQSRPRIEACLDNRRTVLYSVGMPKDLTAVRLRPEQLKQLAKLAAQDQESSISSLIRRAVDEFLAKRKKSRGGN
jgi:hypothetical protein